METVKRTAARAILLTPANEVLLIKITNRDHQWTGWITPGGGIEPGESELTALTRELNEELGFTTTANAKKIWKRFHAFPWNGKWIEQHEVFYLIETAKFNPSQQLNLTETEMLEFKGMQWWKLDEIANSKEFFAPRELATLVEALLKDGAPPEPIEVGA
jgi:8-oxo-dGTP pyrophosphatase MutT (NUDIX family)